MFVNQNLNTSAMTQKAQTTSSRLLSLDVMRGITIAGMILVNNPGKWDSTYVPLHHASWNGLTPTDLVFPSFMFIMGVSLYLSYSKFNFKLSSQTFSKLLRRSALIFLIGLGLNWLGHFVHGLNGATSAETPFFERIWQAATNVEHLRILGVLQRLALVSFAGSLVVLIFKHKSIPTLIALILLIYWIVIAVTNSFELSSTSIVARIDNSIFGENHLYTLHTVDGTPVRFDPEGFFSTLPGIAHVLIGFLAGKIISKTKENHQRIEKLFILGSILLFVGYLISYGFPINKSIWSSSFVLVTCGISLLMLGLLTWIIDIKGKKSWSVFFESFGVNPLFIYVLAGILAIILNVAGFTYNGEWISLHKFYIGEMLVPIFGDYLGSLIYAISFVCLNWLVGHQLYKRNIYIKL